MANCTQTTPVDPYKFSFFFPLIFFNNINIGIWEDDDPISHLNITYYTFIQLSNQKTSTSIKLSILLSTLSLNILYIFICVIFTFVINFYLIEVEKSKDVQIMDFLFICQLNFCFNG